MDQIALGFTELIQPAVLVMLAIGVFAGLIIGSIPGMNDNIAFAVFIPFSFSLPAGEALALMVGVYCSAAAGGAIPAIMIRVPGTASALLTTVNGNALARRGQAGQALSIAMTSSVVGGVLSAIVLLIFAPVLATVALRFGYVENAALTILGLSSVVGLLSGNVIKGILSASLGLLISTIGFSQVSGYPRYTFGSVNLIEGIPFVPILVGLFGVAAVFELLQDQVKDQCSQKENEKLPKIGSMRLKYSLVRRLMPTWLASASIGNFIGMLPGAGMLMAIYIAYDQAGRRFHKKFGGRSGELKWDEGAPEGIAAPEAANNAVTASSMVPLLSLGIPGNSTSALFIGAMALHGLVPGPLLFTQHANIAWMIMVAFLACNLMMGPAAYIVIRTVSRLIFSIPKNVMVGLILLLCLLGAYSDGNNLFNVWIALGAGVVAYLMKIAEIPLGPAILGLVLGSQMEASIANSLSISQGSWFIFIDPINHPISVAMLSLAALMWIAPILRGLRHLRANHLSTGTGH